MNNLSKNSDALSENLKNNLSVLDEKISKYLLTFKQEDFFTFSNREERKERYENEYFSFLLDIKETLALVNKNALEISEQLLVADRNGDNEKIEFYNKIFSSYISFQSVIHEYTTLTEKELSNDVPSVSLLFNFAEKLKMAVSSFSFSL